MLSKTLDFNTLRALANVPNDAKVTIDGGHSVRFEWDPEYIVEARGVLDWNYRQGYDILWEAIISNSITGNFTMPEILVPLADIRAEYSVPAHARSEMSNDRLRFFWPGEYLVECIVRGTTDGIWRLIYDVPELYIAVQKAESCQEPTRIKYKGQILLEFKDGKPCSNYPHSV